jgi:hypothetical protein
MFGSNRKKVYEQVLSRIEPIFRFDAVKELSGKEFSQWFYKDNYVLGFYSSTLLTLTTAASGVNPAQENAKIDTGLQIFVLNEATKQIFGDRAEEMLHHCNELMNGGYILDPEFSRGVVNGKKYIFLTLGMKPLDKDIDVETAQSALLKGATKSLPVECSLAGQYLYDQFISYVIGTYC